MIRATKVRPATSWSETPTDTVVLEFDDRHRRRTVMSGVQGLSFLLDLPDAVMLRGGDALELEDGRLVEVVSAPEPLLEVRAATTEALVRLSWHIGNRHLPAQVLRNAIRIRQDHVIEDMLSGLGAKLLQIEAPFDPEGGAYATAGAHQGDDEHHHHGKGHHGHGHHDHGPKHGHKHDHDAKHDHEAHKHGPKEHKHDPKGHDPEGHHHGHDHHDHDHHGHDHDHRGPGKHGPKHKHDH